MLLLTFTAGPNRYAINVARIVEVVPRVELRSVPHAPMFLAGLLGYRGNVVPVIDLCLLLDVAPCRDCLSTRIILVHDAPDGHNQSKPDLGDASDDIGSLRPDRVRPSNLLGLIAEHVSDLSYLQPEQVMSVPVSVSEAPYLGAVVQTDQGIVQLIVVERIRDAVLKSSLTKIEDAALNLRAVL
jgi:chemotaxis-related protein WspB